MALEQWQEQALIEMERSFAESDAARQWLTYLANSPEGFARRLFLSRKHGVVEEKPPVRLKACVGIMQLVGRSGFSRYSR